MIDLNCSNNENNHCRETVTSYSSRPLRKPLSSRTHFPEYGIISSKHVKTGAPSLSPSARQNVRAHRSSSSPDERCPLPSETNDSRVSDEKKGRFLRMKTATHAKTTVATALPPQKKIAPFQNEFRREPRGTEGKNAKRKVHFHSVHVCYYDEPQQQPQPLASPPGGVIIMSVDDYERQRGPPRPFRSFLKSRTELRRIKRLQRIEDNIADEEWKAIRQQQETIHSTDFDSETIKSPFPATEPGDNNGKQGNIMNMRLFPNRLAFVCKRGYQLAVESDCTVTSAIVQLVRKQTRRIGYNT